MAAACKCGRHSAIMVLLFCSRRIWGPIFAVIYAAIKAVVNTFLRKKDLPVETVKYSYLKNIDEEGFHQLDSRLQRDHEIKDQVDFEQDKKDQEEKNVGEK